MDYREVIECQVKHTIGYSEAEDKKSFMTGVGVSISKMEEHFNSRIEELEKQLEYARLDSERVRGDITQLATIIERYSNRDD